ncbi:MAG: MaoC family dehydratase [Pseudomonas sp.]
MTAAVPASELTSFIGKDMGHSDWMTIDQERVNQFAECTGDHQFIHIDEEKAKQTPFGGTIAHGFLSLSLLPVLSAGLLIRPQGLKMAVNYGMDSLRFIQPVRVGSRVRLHVSVIDVTEKNPGQWLVKSRSTLEIEGSEKPAFISEGLTLYFV